MTMRKMFEVNNNYEKSTYLHKLCLWVEKIVFFSGSKFLSKFNRKTFRSSVSQLKLKSLQSIYENVGPIENDRKQLFWGGKERKKDLHISRLKCATKEYCNS
jgi:hypothetical protein